MSHDLCELFRTHDHSFFVIWVIYIIELKDKLGISRRFTKQSLVNANTKITWLHDFTRIKLVKLTQQQLLISSKLVLVRRQQYTFATPLFLRFPLIFNVGYFCYRIKIYIFLCLFIEFLNVDVFWFWLPHGQRRGSGRVFLQVCKQSCLDFQRNANYCSIER